MSELVPNDLSEWATLVAVTVIFIVILVVGARDVAKRFPLSIKASATAAAAFAIVMLVLSVFAYRYAAWPGVAVLWMSVIGPAVLVAFVYSNNRCRKCHKSKLKRTGEVRQAANLLWGTSPQDEWRCPQCGHVQWLTRPQTGEGGF